jgi:PAS domain S-box-containing protein
VTASAFAGAAPAVTGELPVVLLVEDNPDDQLLVRSALSASSDLVTLHIEQTLHDACRYVREAWVACALLDLSLPDADGLDGLVALREIAPALPIVILTGADDSVGVAAIHAGADDFLTKDSLGEGRLPVVVRYSIERRMAAQHARQSESLIEAALERSPLGGSLLNAAGTFVYANESLTSMLGDDPTGRSLGDLLDPVDWQRVKDEFESMHDGSQLTCVHDFRIATRCGGSLWVEMSAAPVAEGEPGFFAQFQDVTERIRAEMQRSQLAAIVESSADAIISKTVDGIILSWNPGAERLYGYAEAEAVGKPSSMLVPEGQTDEVAGLIARVVSGAPAEYCETARRRKHGSLVQVALTISAVRDANWNVIGASTIARDISERKRMEQELRASERRLALAQAAAGVGTWDWNVATNEIFWSPEMEELYGLVPGGFEGHYEGWSRTVHPEDLPEAERGLAEAVETMTDWRLDFRIMRADGAERWMAASARPYIDDTGVCHVVGVNIDVTEQAISRHELEESERYFRAVFDNADEALLVIDDSGRCVMSNPAARLLTGYLEPDDLGRVTDFVTLPDVIPDREHSVGGMRAGRHEYPLRRADGMTRNVEFLVTPDVVPGRHLAALRDVTEQRHRDADAAQSRRLESIGQLAGGIAHDFNNVLSIIQNYSRFVASRVTDDAVRSDIEVIQGAAERAASLTRQLLIFSRRDPTTLVPTDLRTVVAETATILTRTLGEDVQVITELCDADAVTLSDRGQLEQVLLNLAVNSRDAMPDGGTLTIAVEDKRGGNGVADLIVLTVRDTGAGMDEETLTHAFDPFFTTKPSGAGTGLGLATVYGIVARAGGQLRITSTPGEGTTVTLSLPRFAGSVTEQEPIAPAEPTEPQLSRVARILIVEDEPGVLELTRRILQERGYEVLTAINGERALDLLEGESVDLVLTDVVMPGMGGIRLAAELRAQDSQTRIAFMSGYSERGQSLSEHEALLDKPFDDHRLLEFVASQLVKSD